VAHAAEKTSASGGARIDGTMAMRFQGIRIPMTIDGAISFDDRRMRMTLDYGHVKGLPDSDLDEVRSDSGMPMQLVQTPDEMYISTSQLRERGRADGVEWAQVDLSELDDKTGLDLQRANQFTEVNPEAMLRALRTTGDARKTGSDNIRGVVADRYSGTIDMRRYPELVPAKDRETAKRTADVMVKQWGGPTQTLDVWIDDRGLILRERMPMHFSVDGEKVKALLVLDFLDAGRAQQVEVPDGDSVVDVTDKVADKVGG
jgi:hypothetical protein